jgi:hypothetical protein
MRNKLALIALVSFFAFDAYSALTCKSVLSGGKDFIVQSRGQAEKQFKKEQQAFEKAGPDELVAVEWIFLPYYMPLGHSALRVGNTAWEFTSKGWKVHGEGADTARAFLYNNPFFKTQYAKSPEEIPPMAMGTTRYFKKSVVEKIFLQNDALAQAESFSLMFRNCNQCLTDLSLQSGFDFSQPQNSPQ